MITEIYKPKFIKAVIYMLQSCEYQPMVYLKWFWTTSDFRKVIYRKQLVNTTPTKLLYIFLLLGIVLQYILGVFLIANSIQNADLQLFLIGLAILISTPIIWAQFVIIPIVLGRFFITAPKTKREISKSKQDFIDTKAIKIAVAGSYGKTTMKEMLKTVLSESKQVKATPANKNVAISHAKFASSLDGKEQILIIEYGEGAPGDVAKFTTTTKPDIGIITGLAPAHLDKYKTLDSAGKDIFALADYLDDEDIYVNSESPAINKFIKPSHNLYNQKEVLGWKIRQLSVSTDGVRFKLTKGPKTISIKSKLVGKHQVGPLALVATLAEKLGLKIDKIESAISKIEPHEHRMQPYKIGDADIIDDTYNGNIDGIRAGLDLLKTIPASRKIYVTPGLVDQGKQSKQIHQELGKLIKQANPDIVVLIKHSVTEFILSGMQGYKGKLIIERDPLNFYTNLDKFVANGDLVLMQNDWPDNYT